MSSPVRHSDHPSLAAGSRYDIDGVLVICPTIDRDPFPVRRPRHQAPGIPDPRHLGESDGLARDVRIDFTVEWNHPEAALGDKGQLGPVG